ncbi:MAG TPA: FAD-linked oxidase C-terminal domain-containing protein [Nitriliruptorales bacterium]|nr:FAD-linked oxidase C-terminal domain-containing protein [Nitriliruptorales bacterium]
MTPTRPPERAHADHRPRPAGGRSVDVGTLAADLSRTIDGEVRFDAGSRHLYSTDASNFRQVPIGVVVPRTVQDVIDTVALCRRHGAAVTSRGGGTSLAGQACNVAVVIDFSKYVTDIIDIDVEARTATVRPGLVLDDLRARTAEHGLTWGPSPSTHNSCTIGGMLGNNACGMHAFAFGRAEDNVEELDVLLHDGTRMTVGATSDGELRRTIAAGGREGEIYGQLRELRDRHADRIRARFPDIPRRVSGYNLIELLPENGFHVARALVGTEGTCVTILGAKLQLNPLPPQNVLVALGYEDIYAAGRAVADVRHADGLYALEGIDQHLIDNIAEKGLRGDALQYLPDGRGWLLCEFRGHTKQQATSRAQALIDELDRRGHRCGRHVYDSEQAQEEVWTAREAGLGATALFQGRHQWPGWEDSAVHPDQVGDYLDDLRELFGEHGFDPTLYGHFGDGCIHCRIAFDLTTPDGVATYRGFLERAADLVCRYGGSLSGEHGDGQQRGELLDRMYGPELVQAMREFKAIWDPDGRMNPGKVVSARPLDADLRLGAEHQWRPTTRFAYPHDGYDFKRAQLRCVGVGKCRRDDGAGTMCPSYMVTREEMHSTRGRARLLFEMLQPDSELDGWRDEHVKEALELCLSCKGCTTDCPVNVDMPTYKAEFFHHHYRGRLHPPAHYALGLIDVWSGLAQRAPGLANAILSAPGVSTLLKKTAGVARERPAPRYTARSFRTWFQQRQPVNVGARQVILFDDTFTDHFTPSVGRAAVEILEDAGYHVLLPPRQLCCGRPLYDYGFLDRAERYLDRLLAAVGPAVSRGVRIVGLEPSCVAVFRDELVKMKPHDDDARRVAASTYMLSEFLNEIGYEYPRLQRTAIVHGHCHHKAAMGMAQEAKALDAIGLDWSELDAGCCGLAGSFGFEAGDKFRISVEAGERKLLPAVRKTDDDTLIITNGFSCATQITHLQQLNGSTGRRSLHLAQVIQLAKRSGPDGPSGPGPVEDSVVADVPASAPRAITAASALVGGIAAVGWATRRRRSER